MLNLGNYVGQAILAQMRSLSMTVTCYSSEGEGQKYRGKKVPQKIRYMILAEEILA